MGMLLNDIVLVSLRGSVANQRILCVLTYAVKTPGTGGHSVSDECISFATACKSGGTNDIMTSYLDCLQDEYTAQDVTVQCVAPVRYVSERATDASGGTGGPGNYTNLAACLTKRCVFAGRKFVASMHIGPISNGAATDGILTNTMLAKMLVLAGKFENNITYIGAGVLEPVIWHRNTPGPAIDFTPINEVVTEDAARTMRRRTVGRGE